MQSSRFDTLFASLPTSNASTVLYHPVITKTEENDALCEELVRLRSVVFQLQELVLNSSPYLAADVHKIMGSVPELDIVATSYTSFPSDPSSALSSYNDFIRTSDQSSAVSGYNDFIGTRNQVFSPVGCEPRPAEAYPASYADVVSQKCPKPQFHGTNFSLYAGRWGDYVGIYPPDSKEASQWEASANGMVKKPSVNVASRKLESPGSKIHSPPCSPILASHENATGLSSPELEALGSHKDTKRRNHGASLKEMKGQIVYLASTQSGSRFLQKKLDENGCEAVSLVLEEVAYNIINLAKDPYGQYLLPKMMEHSTAEQRRNIFEMILPHAVLLACNSYGSHSLQKMLPFVGSSECATLIKTFQEHFMEIVSDSKGVYLVQALLKAFGNEQCSSIYESVQANCLAICTQKFGCTLVARCMENASSKQKTNLCEALCKYSLGLAQDMYGNYTIQYLLGHAPSEFVQTLLTTFWAHLKELSLHKFGSNVVEKCLEVAQGQYLLKTIEELSKTEVIQDLLKDQYGNFVVQKALDYATTDQHVKLVQVICRILQTEPQRNEYLRHIEKKLLQA